MLATGLAVGLESLPGLEFRPNGDWTCCRLCGLVLQRPIDRHPENYANAPGYDGSVELVREYATATRKRWSHEHAKTHTVAEHNALRISGRWCTPEAAARLVAFGIINLGDLIFDDEIANALRDSSAVPTDDALPSVAYAS